MLNSINKTTENQLLNSDWGIRQYQQITQQEITRAVLAARKNERATIAYQIQEELNQVLIAALLYIELAKTDDESREICLEKSGSFISTVIKELTNMSRTLEVENTFIKKIDL